MHMVFAGSFLLCIQHLSLYALTCTVLLKLREVASSPVMREKERDMEPTPHGEGDLSPQVPERSGSRTPSRTLLACREADRVAFSGLKGP